MEHSSHKSSFSPWRIGWDGTSEHQRIFLPNLLVGAGKIGKIDLQNPLEHTTKLGRKPLDSLHLT